MWMCDDGGAACTFTHIVYVYSVRVCDMLRRNNVKRKITIFLFEIVRSVVRIIHVLFFLCYTYYKHNIHAHSIVRLIIVMYRYIILYYKMSTSVGK